MENQLLPVIERLEKGQKTPICVIIVGMAGSGKSSLMSQMQHHANTTMMKPAAAAAAAAESKPAATATARDQEGGENQDDSAGGTMPTNNNNNSNLEKTTTGIGVGEGNETSTPPPPSPVLLPTYCVNLDPATHHLAYDASIDIRDTINYKEVMKQHNLGPNGAIMTSLNLYATKFDQVMGILEKRAYGSSTFTDAENESSSPSSKDQQANTNEATTSSERDQQQQSTIADNSGETVEAKKINDDDEIGMEYILVDTPGQIEAFTWSASGSIISESLASAFPTVLCFVVDTVRCASSPNTFMSNMLYACSMFYRTRLPLVIVFNKNDVVPHDFAMEWMTDHDTFQEALDESMDSNTNNSSTMTSTGFYGSLTRSLSLVLDEFYSNFTHCCGVSAVTGDGMDDLWACIRKAALEDFSMDYIEDLKNRMEEQQAKQRAIARASVRRMQRDLQQQGPS